MTDTDKKNIQSIKDYVRSLDTPDNVVFQENKLLIMACFNKAMEIIESNAQAAYIASMEMIKERYPANADDIRPRQEDYNQA